MASTLLYSLVGVVIFIYALDAYFCRKRDPNEPKNLRPRIPLIGHPLGLMYYGNKYYEMVSAGEGEIIALPIFSFRLYVVNSRSMFPAMQRNAKTISFRPFQTIAADKWCETSKEYLDMYKEGHEYLDHFNRAMRTSLMPGPFLDYQNIQTGESMLRFFARLDEDVTDFGLRNFGLYEWLRHMISVSATDGVLGRKHNPLRNPQVEAAYWTWTGMFKKKLAAVPNAFLKTEIDARELLFDAFEEYLKKDISDAAEITKARKRVNDENNVSIRDQARTQASFLIALLNNTVPTVFWALYVVISHPRLLQQIRLELKHNIITKSASGTSFTLDVGCLRTICPLLLSSYQEMQRTRSRTASIRKILEDTVVESPVTPAIFLLRKGNYLQMPSVIMHGDPNTWGPSVSEFDPYRFVKDNGPLPYSKLPSSYAFTPWGHAPHQCPARQFASTEIMLCVALFILRFELSAPSGVWEDVPVDMGDMSAIRPPKSEVFLDVKRREGWQGEWKLVMGDSSKAKIPLASG